MSKNSIIEKCDMEYAQSKLQNLNLPADIVCEIDNRIGFREDSQLIFFLYGYRTAENRVCKWKSPDDEPNYTTSCGNELDYFLFNDTLKNLGTRCLFCGGKIEVVE